MTTTLITGANKGLGYETARRLIEAGHSVIVGARDAERGKKAAAELGARFVQLDVTDDASVQSAVADVKANEGTLDVLVNNAGIGGPYSASENLTSADAFSVFDTNVFSIVRVTNAFLPLMRNRDAQVINVTSGLGSFHAVLDASRVEHSVVSPLYCASKSAVTMLTVQYAKGIKDVRFNAADPGYTATDLNANSGPQTVEEGTDAVVTLATSTGTETGTFTDRHGIAPW